MWCYRFERDRNGTLVSETFEWHWTPTPKEGFRKRMGLLPIDEATTHVEARQRHLRDEIRATLANLKRVLEATSPGP